MESSSTLISRSMFEGGCRVEFYKKDEQVVATVYHEIKKVGECFLGRLPVFPTYEKLPALERSEIDVLLKKCEVCCQLRSKSVHGSNNQDQKVAQVASKTICHANDDSDEEWEGVDSQEKLFVFKKDLSIPASAMTICAADQNVKGSKLIEIAHSMVLSRYEEVVNLCCEYEKDIGGAILSPPIEKNGILEISAPVDWILSLGGWKGMMPREEVKEYFVYDFYPEKVGTKFSGVKIHQSSLIYPIINGRLHLPKGFSINQVDITTSREMKNGQWVKIPGGKTDLSYSKITKAIETIKQAFGWNDSKIAILQLCALSRAMNFPSWFEKKISQQNQSEILHFLDYLNGLMFGIEASGLNAALVTGLMTLDLIVHGRLDYQTAFYANKDGGVYPYACFGNNSGTYHAREKILTHKKEKGDSFSMKEFRRNTTLSPVATKEAILIKDWLEYHGVVLEKETGIPQSAQIEVITEAIKSLMNCYFSPWLDRPNYYLKKFSEKLEI